MGFTLPRHNKLNQGKGRFTHSDEEAAPGTPIIRKELEPGILGEANNDGTIFVDVSVEPNSELERHVLTHEMKHMTHMKIGKLGYTDSEIIWNGESYPRLNNGKVLFEGKEFDEGDSRLPWENV